MKKILFFLGRLAAVVSLFSIPLVFYYSGTAISGAMDSVLKAKIYPAYSGGEVRATVYDPAGDDTGAGAYTYPLSAQAAAGALDLVKYTVSEPLVNTTSVVSGLKDYWQVAVTLAALPDPDEAPAGFSVPAIKIYIDTDGEASGSRETASPRAELVTFDPAHPWDVGVEIDGFHKSARLVTADGKITRRISLIVMPSQSTVYVRLPLDIPEIKRILDGRPTWHYVLVGAYDPHSSGSLMPLAAEAGRRNGGGATSRLAPRIFDCLVPKGKTQTAVLSAFSEAEGSYAVLYPVAVEKGVRTKAAELDELKRKAADEEAAAIQATREKNEQALPAASGDDKIGLLFSLGRYAETEALVQERLQEDGEQPVPLAFAGSLKAAAAGRAGDPAEAVRLVNEAFAYFARAEAADRSDGERLLLFMCRGSVCLALPEGVFHKSEAGALDFLQAAELFIKTGDTRPAQTAYLNAARAFERAGQTPSAEQALLKAAAIKPLSAQTVYELAKAGIELD